MNKNPLEDIDAMLWARGWYVNLDKKWLGSRIIVHGHTPTKRPVLEERLQNILKRPIINVDCGCYYKKEGLGFLAAFDLDNQEYIFQQKKK